jgi:hypothetical protein
MGKKEWMEADRAASRWRGKDLAASGVRCVGAKTFYKNKEVWQDVEVAASDSAREVAYFSEEFFRVLEEKPALCKFVAAHQTVEVKHEGTVYRFKKG